MAQQRDIFMVSFPLSQGHELHPVIIISTNTIYETEGGYYGIMCSAEHRPQDFSVEITANMMVGGKPMRKKTYAKTHLIAGYQDFELTHHIGTLTIDAFSTIKAKIIESIFEDQ